VRKRREGGRNRREGNVGKSKLYGIRRRKRRLEICERGNHAFLSSFPVTPSHPPPLLPLPKKRQKKIEILLTLPVAIPKAATGRVPPEAGISTILLAVVAVRVLQLEKMWP
jgi:hypothetical protein